MGFNLAFEGLINFSIYKFGCNLWHQNFDITHLWILFLNAKVYSYLLIYSDSTYSHINFSIQFPIFESTIPTVSISLNLATFPLCFPTSILTCTKFTRICKFYDLGLNVFFILRFCLARYQYRFFLSLPVSLNLLGIHVSLSLLIYVGVIFLFLQLSVFVSVSQSKLS